MSLCYCGQGSWVPVTNNELMLVAIIFSTCLGTISSFISQVAGVHYRFQAKARVPQLPSCPAVTAAADQNLVPPQQHRWRRSAKLHEQHALLNDLSPFVQQGPSARPCGASAGRSYRCSFGCE